jgi:outer membrane murein-binding lipoprotein Lpp
MTERSTVRRFDAGTLKEIRKRLDTGACSQAEIDQIATDLLEDCVDVGGAPVCMSEAVSNCASHSLQIQLSSDVSALYRLRERMQSF